MPATSAVATRRSLRYNVKLIKQSELFDPAWYKARYHASTGIDDDPIVHYLRIGASLGFDPGPGFSTAGYLDANPDVAESDLNPLVHYLRHGRREGRSLSRLETSPSRPPSCPPPFSAHLVVQFVRRQVSRPLARYTVMADEASREGTPLRRVSGVFPRRWCLVTMRSNLPLPPLTLHVLDDTQELAAELPRPGSPTLVRLPAHPARLSIDPTGSSGAPLGLAHWPEEVFVRSIGRLEVGLRLLAQLIAQPRGLAAAAWQGRAAAYLRAYVERHVAKPVSGYRRWVRLYDTHTPAELRKMRRRAEAMRSPPLISVIVPTFDTAPQALREMLGSVRAQVYPHWELCIADDASTRPHVREILKDLAAQEPRVRLCLRERNGDISAASNSALALATGTFAALLDHDDLLPPHALMTVAETIARYPTADLLYSDEDKIDAEGKRYDPYFKPDYNPELMQSQNFISHLGVYRLELLRALGGFREGFEGSQDYDLALRVAARTRSPIVHIPQILYHWRINDSVRTYSSRHLSRATDAARRAIAEQCGGGGKQADVAEAIGNYHRLVWRAPAAWPKVTAIIPTRDRGELLRECIDGLLNRTRYANLDIIVVDNESTQRATLAYLQQVQRHGVRVIRHAGPFNYSAINNAAAREAEGEWLLLLNNDIVVLEPTWLQEMVQRTRAPRVGAVGARLLYPDRTIQHAGVVLGLGGAAGHPYVGADRNDPGYFGQLQIAHEVSAVTGACMLVSRAAFMRVGGLDEANLPVAFNDVDLCLRLRETGWRIVWTPFAELIHHESKSRGSDFTPARVEKFRAEVAYVQARWGELLEDDPFFNPNLSLSNATPTPAFPPRWRRWPEGATAVPQVRAVLAS